MTDTPADQTPADQPPALLPPDPAQPPAPNYYGFDPKRPFPPPNPYGGYAYPADARTNGMAITALIMGLLGFLFITACVGIGFGFGAIGTINRSGQPGKGLAIAGIVLSSVWLALWVLLFILA
jgi:hypothetical protein